MRAFAFGVLTMIVLAVGMGIVLDTMQQATTEQSARLGSVRLEGGQQ
jgi:hypothetical protein